MKALVVVPTYNEAPTIARLVDAVRREVPDVDILVVDDDSPDGTGTIVRELAGSDPHVRLMTRSGPRGFGPAYVDGFRDGIARGYDAIVQMDSDLSHPPRFVRDFLREIATCDLVIGSRYARGGRTEDWPLHRWLLSRGGNLYARLVLGLPLADLTGGFKCWRREALLSIGLDDLMASGFAFQMEMNHRAFRSGLRIREIPIAFPNRTAGESKMAGREFAESIRMPWRLRRRYGAGPPGPSGR